jgi:decaprenylphospho-beta-D-ribofuranose 2-oxidase
MVYSYKRCIVQLLALNAACCLSYGSIEYKKFFEIPFSSSVYIPTACAEVQDLVKRTHQKRGKIAIRGAGKSQGGQTVCKEAGACTISLHKLNKLVKLDRERKEVTVEAGMTWRTLQEHIAPYRLAVKAMQSYNDFSIGGSLGVNVHGQDFKAGPLIETVLSFKLVLPHGELIEVSRTHNAELFGLAIGGYGLFGVIVEVTLSLTDDVLMERKAAVVKTQNLATYFLENIKNNPYVEFYSARFSLGDDDLLQKALVITYQKTDKKKPELFSLDAPVKSSWQRQLLVLLKKFNPLKTIRFYLEEQYVNRSKVLSRNNFMNYSVESLPQDTANSRYILQEYFIPYEYLNDFTRYLGGLIRRYSINILNLTARHVHRNTESLLSYSSKEACALVLYLNVEKNPKAYQKTVMWTRKLLDKALALGGTFYLPYQLIATQEQLEAAYPSLKQCVALKKQYDPQEIFRNQFYSCYAQ